MRESKRSDSNKSPLPTENSKQQSDNTKRHQTSITQRLRTNLGRSVEVTISTKLVWFSLTAKAFLSKGHIYKHIDNTLYKDRITTTNLSREVIKQLRLKIVYQNISSKPPVPALLRRNCKRA